MREVNHVKRFKVTCCSNYSIQHYVIKFVRDLRQVGGFLRVLQFPLPIKLTTTRYNWNIVESGIKHHLYVYIYFPRIIQDKYTILVHCRSIWVICVWGLETWEKARLRRAFSRVSRRIHIFTYMLRQCTCIVFILQF
jgi:hypothetical protein